MLHLLRLGKIYIFDLYILNGGKMKRTILKKIMVCCFLSAFMVTTAATSLAFTPVSQHSDQETATLRVIDGLAGTTTEQQLTREKTETLITLMKICPTRSSFTKDMQDILGQLCALDLISKDTAQSLITTYQVSMIHAQSANLAPTGPFFDVFNVFNGVFFALKGTKDTTIFELNLYNLPFINSNITAQFSLLSKFTGEGFIFTLGAMGFKYIYDFNMTSYAFPYFSKISGVITFFTGVLLELEIGDKLGEEYMGSYKLGFGTNMLSIWNNMDENDSESFSDKVSS